MSNPFDNLNIRKTFRLPGLPNMDEMLLKQAIQEQKKKELHQKPQLLGGNTAQIKAAPPKAIMKAAPKELLGGSNATIGPDTTPNFPRDMNNIFKGIGDAWNNGVMGDWYDKEHQTLAYRTLHPDWFEKDNPEIVAAMKKYPVEANQGAKTPAQAVNKAAEEAISGNIVRKMVNKPASSKGSSVEKVSNKESSPAPQLQTPIIPETSTQVSNNSAPTRPLVATPDDKPITVQVPTDPNAQALATNVPAVINSESDPGAVIPVVNQPPQSQIKDQGQPSNVQPEPSSFLKPIIQNPIEQANQHTQERDAMAEQSRPMIMKALGLPNTDENWWRLKNNFIPPNRPWAMDHPVASTVSNLLMGLAQGAFASGNGNIGANLVRGLGQGAANATNSVIGARDAYNQEMTKFQQGASAGIERGRVYNVPGLGLNTSLSAGELQALQNAQDDRVNNYNKAVDNFNDSQFALGANPQKGDYLGAYGQQAKINERVKINEENRTQAKSDAIVQKLAAIQQFVQANPNKPIPAEMLAGIPYEALKGYVDPVTLSSMAQNQAQLEAYKNKHSEFQQEQAIKQYVMEPKNWNDVSTRVRTEYGDEGYNLFYNAMQTGNPDKVFEVLKFLEQQKNDAERLNDQKRRTEIVDRNSRRKDKTGRGARGRTGSSTLTPEQQSQSKSIYPGK